MQNENDSLLLASEAGRVLKKSAEQIRYYERTGKLAALRTAGGMRLFRRSEIDRFAAELAARDTEAPRDD